MNHVSCTRTRWIGAVWPKDNGIRMICWEKYVTCVFFVFRLILSLYSVFLRFFFFLTLRFLSICFDEFTSAPECRDRIHARLGNGTVGSRVCSCLFVSGHSELFFWYFTRFLSSSVDLEGIPFQQYGTKQVGTRRGHWPQISPTLRSEPLRKDWTFSKDRMTWFCDQRSEVAEKHQIYSQRGSAGKNDN